MGHTLSTILSVGSIVAAPFTAGTSLAWLPSALGAGAAVVGAIQGQNQQNQQQGFVNTAFGNQSQALSQAEALAQEEARGLPFQTLLDVQRGGIESIKNQIGGIPNIGNLVKQLEGGDVTNALEAGINTKNSALNSAINAMLGAGSQYGTVADEGLSLTQNQQNPWAAAYGPLQQLAGLFGNKGSNTPTSTPTSPSNVANPPPPGTLSGGPWDTSGSYSPSLGTIG